MTTAGDLVDITKYRYLTSGVNELRNKLAANYTAGQTTLAFTYPLGGISSNTTLTIGLNTFYVWAVDAGAQTAVVQGGYHGTTDVNANAGAFVNVNPRYSDFDILNALNEELAALSAPGVGLYQMLQTEFAYNASRAGYDLPGVTDIIGIHEVRYDSPDQYKRTPRMDSIGFRLERNYLVSENSSTYSLKLFQHGYPGRNVTVLYKAAFTSLTSLAANVSTTGLPASAMDIPPMGAALRLGVGREVRRNDITTQGDTRRAEEVPAGAVAGSWRGLMQLRATRIAEEASRLQSLYPVRT